MRRLGKPLSALLFTLVTVFAADANLIINGSFEQHPQFQNGSWGLFSSIPGWTAVGQYPIEIGTGPTYGVTGFAGNDVMELDSTGNVKVDQILATPGGSYTLSFLYARRGNVGSETCSFDVLWNGVLVTTVSPTVTPMSTVMSLFSTTVLGATSNILEFRGAGTQDSYGALIDDVRLVAVPEPTTLIASALLLLPFGMSTIRFIRKNRTA